MKLLILGVTGMLGNACLSYFGRHKSFDVIGTARDNQSSGYFHPNLERLIRTRVDIVDAENRDFLFESERPDVVINCIGLVKQIAESNNPLHAIALNAMLPHQLANTCQKYNARLIHISTDCVFSGQKGTPYLETDIADANDLYGRTKLLGEISNNPSVLTLRTSYIGNELQSSNGLLEWFLDQEGVCSGYTNAIYSGLPTITLMGAIENILLNHSSLFGLYHVSSSPISKFHLLKLISEIFNKKIDIIPSDNVVINRSLDASKFEHITGFKAPDWKKMIEDMYLDRIMNVQK